MPISQTRTLRLRELDDLPTSECWSVLSQERSLGDFQKESWEPEPKSLQEELLGHASMMETVLVQDRGRFTAGSLFRRKR